MKITLVIFMLLMALIQLSQATDECICLAQVACQAATTDKCLWNQAEGWCQKNTAAYFAASNPLCAAKNDKTTCEADLPTATIESFIVGTDVFFYQWRNLLVTPIRSSAGVVTGIQGPGTSNLLLTKVDSFAKTGLQTYPNTWGKFQYIAADNTITGDGLLCDGNWVQSYYYGGTNINVATGSNAVDLADCKSKCFTYGRGCTVVSFREWDKFCKGYSLYTGTCEPAPAGDGFKTYRVGLGQYDWTYVCNGVDAVFAYNGSPSGGLSSQSDLASCQATCVYPGCAAVMWNPYESTSNCNTFFAYSGDCSANAVWKTYSAVSATSEGVICDGLSSKRAQYDYKNLGTAFSLAGCRSKCLSSTGCTVVAFQSTTTDCWANDLYPGDCQPATGEYLNYKTYNAFQNTQKYVNNYVTIAKSTSGNNYQWYSPDANVAWSLTQNTDTGCSWMTGLGQCYEHQSCMCLLTFSNWYNQAHGPAKLGANLGSGLTATFPRSSYSPQAALVAQRASRCTYTGATEKLLDGSGNTLTGDSVAAQQVTVDAAGVITVRFTSAAVYTTFLIAQTIPAVAETQGASTVQRTIQLSLYDAACSGQGYVAPASFQTTYTVSGMQPLVQGRKWDRTNNGLAELNMDNTAINGGYALHGCEVTSYTLSSSATSDTPIGGSYPTEATLFANGNYNFEIKTGATGSKVAYIWAHSAGGHFASSQITITSSTTCSAQTLQSPCAAVSGCSWSGAACVDASCASFTTSGTCTSTDCYWKLSSLYMDTNYPHLEACVPFDANVCNPQMTATSPEMKVVAMYLPQGGGQQSQTISPLANMRSPSFKNSYTICTNVNPTTFPTSFVIASDKSGDTVVSSQVMSIVSNKLVIQYTSVTSATKYLVMKSQNSYAFQAINVNIYNYCETAQIVQMKLLQTQTMDKNFPYISTYNWDIRNASPQCLPVRYTLTETDGRTPAPGFTTTSVAYTSDTQQILFNWDGTTTVGTASSPKSLLINMYLDTSDRFVAQYLIQVISYPGAASPCTGQGFSLGPGVQLKYNTVFLKEKSQGGFKINPATYYGIKFEAQSASCDIVKIIVVKGEHLNPQAAFETPYPDYMGGFPVSQANLMNIDWDISSNETQEISVFGINSIYTTTPVIFFKIYNYCNNNITLSNSAIPAFPRSLTAMRTTYDFTKNYQFSRTDNIGCAYESQNVYSDQALTTMIYSQPIPTATNTTVPAITYQVDQNVPAGTYTVYYHLKMGVAYYAQRNNTCDGPGAKAVCGEEGAIPVQYTVCGLETIKIMDTMEQVFSRNVLPDQVNMNIGQSVFGPQFQLDNAASSPQCVITQYVLCEDITCSKLFSSTNVWMWIQNSKSNLWISNVTNPASASLINYTMLQPADTAFSIAYKRGTTYTEKMFVGAITNGFVIGAFPLTIEMKCGSEIFTLNNPNFINLDEVMKTKTITIEKATDFDAMFTSDDYFTSTIDKTICPIVSKSIEIHDTTVYKGQAAIGSNRYTYGNFAINKRGMLMLITDNFKKAGYYYADLVGTSAGGVEVRIPYQINIQATADSVTSVVNYPPSFSPAINSTTEYTIVPNGQLVTWKSPKASDPEGATFTMKVDFEGIPSSVKVNVMKDQFEILLDQASFKESDAKAYTVKITLDDGVSKASETSIDFDIKYPVEKNTTASSNSTSTNTTASGTDETGTTETNTTSTETTGEDTTEPSSGTTAVTKVSEEKAPVVETTQEIQEKIAKTLDAPVKQEVLEAPMATQLKVSTATWQKTQTAQQFSAQQVAFTKQIQQRLKARYQRRQDEKNAGVIRAAEKPTPPLSILPPKVEQNGHVGLQFSEKVFVPSFVTDGNQGSSTNKRRLTALDQINVSRDVADVSLVINSNVDPKDIKYFLSITEWTDEGISLFMNVTTPLLISKGIKRDQAIIRVKNPYLFICQKTGKPIKVKPITMSLPRMLPKDVNITNIKASSKAAGSAMQGFVYGQIFLQVFMKGSMEDMWGAFFSLQLLCQLTLYGIPIPANGEMYVEQFRKLVDFDLFKPNNILPMIHKGWSTEYFIGISKVKVTGAMESSGIQSGNVIYNMSTFIFMGLAAFAAFALLSVLLLVKKFHDKIKAKLVDILKKTFFNNLIRSHSISYIHLTVSFSIVIYLEMEKEKAVNLKQIAPLIALGVIPIFLLKVLLSKRETLDTLETREKIERMYQDIALTRNSWTIYYYPMFLLRRFFFVVIPILLPDYPIIQVIVLGIINLLFVMFMGAVQPHVTFKKRCMEFFNEYMIMLISLHLLCFTDFITDAKIYFYIGYIFAGNMGFCFLMNIMVMLHTNFLKFKIKQKKKRVQKAYEARFKEQKKILSKLKEEKENMVTVQLEEKLAFYSKGKFEIEYGKIKADGKASIKLRRDKKFHKKIKMETSLDKIVEMSGESMSIGSPSSSDSSSSSSSSDHEETKKANDEIHLPESQLWTEESGGPATISPAKKKLFVSIENHLPGILQKHFAKHFAQDENDEVEVVLMDIENQKVESQDVIVKLGEQQQKMSNSNAVVPITDLITLSPMKATQVASIDQIVEHKAEHKVVKTTGHSSNQVVAPVLASMGINSLFSGGDGNGHSFNMLKSMHNAVEGAAHGVQNAARGMENVVEGAAKGVQHGVVGAAQGAQNVAREGADVIGVNSSSGSSSEDQDEDFAVEIGLSDAFD